MVTGLSAKTLPGFWVTLLLCQKVSSFGENLGGLVLWRASVQKGVVKTGFGKK